MDVLELFERHQISHGKKKSQSHHGKDSNVKPTEYNLTTQLESLEHQWMEFQQRHYTLVEAIDDNKP